MMKKYFLLLLTIVFLTFSDNVTAQQASLKSDSLDISIKKLNIKTNIIGNIAVTSYDMYFYNPYDRVLEGELLFPLKSNQSVTKFALQVNKTLRNAVIIEKETARVAFENTVRQEIDPAILEQIKGNNYKARVYPIPPKGYKRVLIEIEEELNSINENLVFNLDLNYQNLDFFNLLVNIPNQDKKPICRGYSFKNDGEDYRLETNLGNVSVKENIHIEIPNNNEKLITFNEYFYFYKKLQPNQKVKKKPNHITLLWDNSYSTKNKNITKEIELLNDYISFVKNCTIELIRFNIKKETSSLYKIENGEWNTLKTDLLNTIYDGGTSFSNLFTKSKTDEYLCFTDGIDNLGLISKKNNTPIYIINSSSTSNHTFLNNICNNSGGSYIDLKVKSNQQAFSMLSNNTYQFLGIDNNTLKNIEVYPSKPLNVTNNFSISGKGFIPNDQVSLYFGYGSKIEDTIIFSLKNTSKGLEKIQKIWAQKKNQQLLKNKTENKDKIINVSKKYQIISPFTSLIVLDRVEDYVRYNITPPKELLEEYNNLLRARKNNVTNSNEEIDELKKDLLSDYDEIVKWTKTNFKKKKKESKKSKNSPEILSISSNPTINQANSNNHNNSITNNNTNTNPNPSLTNQNNNLTNINIDPNRNIVSGVIVDENNLPLPGATILIKGTTTGTSTDFDGKYSINANPNDVLEISYVGYSSQIITIATNSINVTLQPDNELEEVVVTAYGTARQAEQISYSVEIVKKLQGTVSGLKVENSTNNNLTIRGLSTQNNNQKPLYIVDGVPVTETDFKSLGKNNISSLSTLKNSAAVGLYGNKGSNGVFIITTKDGEEKKQDQIKEFNDLVSQKLELKSWIPDTPYLNIIKRSNNTQQAYKKYLGLRNEYGTIPAFYLDISDYFIERNESEIALKILSNIAEIDISNYELLRVLAYKLESLNQYQKAVYIYKEILNIRPEDIQSYRDLALAYQEIGEYQKSLDLLYQIVNGDLLNKDINRRFEGIESISFVEMNSLIQKHKKELSLKAIDNKYIKKITSDIRFVIDWNHNDTDIDLWVIDPFKEKCFYKNDSTQIGGKLSLDMIEGFGPEEFMLKKAPKGKYDFIIDYFADEVQKISGPTYLKATLFKNYGTKKETKQTIVYRLGKDEEELNVGNIIIK